MSGEYHISFKKLVSAHLLRTIVRVLVADNSAPEQVQLAQQLLAKSGRVFIPQVVQIELVWVLESAFGFDKQSVLSVLDVLVKHPFCELQHESVFNQALTRFRESGAGFADSLIAAESELVDKRLWTFDRKLSHQSGVHRLTEQSLGDLVGKQ